MKKKKLCMGIVLLLFLTIGIQPAHAEAHTLWVGVDTDFGTWSGRTFTFNSNPPVGDSISIAENEVIINGNGKTLQYTSESTGVGVDINGNNGITVKNLTITGFPNGIRISNSNLGPAEPKENIFINNTITNATDEGIRLFNTNSTTISDNNISDCLWAIFLENSGNTDIWDPPPKFTIMVTKLQGTLLQAFPEELPEESGLKIPSTTTWN